MRPVSHNLYTLRCRMAQAALKLGNYFMGYHTPRCLEGAGAVTRLPALLAKLGLRNVLVVTGAHLMSRGLPHPMLDAMDRAEIQYTVFSMGHPDPTTDDVEAGYRLFESHGCRAIVALGGGSRIDCAKAIGAKSVHPRKKIAQLQGLLKVHRRVPPLFAIPTTAGAGSETTIAAVIIDSATHRKASINDPALIPQYAVLDPVLTAGLPPRTTAATGMDALSHAVESYTNQAYNTPLEDRLAKEAVKLIHDNLLIAYRDGSDLEARQNMQRAAFAAGRAFTRGGVGYVHAIGHTLGGLYGVPHGEAMAMLLPAVMRSYGPAVHRRLGELAEVCGITGNTDAAKADKFLDWVEDLRTETGLGDRLDMVREEDIDQMISWAMAEANPVYPVPVIWQREQFRDLIESLRR